MEMYKLDGFLALAVLIGLIFLPAVLGHFKRRGEEYIEYIKNGRPTCDHGNRPDRCKACRDERIQEHERKKELSRAAVLHRSNEFNRLKKANMRKLSYLRSLPPQKFEAAVIAMFRKLGYTVAPTPFINDRGKDAIAEKNGEKYLIECKRYGEKNRVGRPDLQKFFAAMVEEEALKGFFVTTGNFSQPAIEYGRENNIEMINHHELIDMMKQAFKGNHASDSYTVLCENCGDLVEFDIHATDKNKLCKNNHTVIGDLGSELHSTDPVERFYCDLCGLPLRFINGKKGKFWLCTGYPKYKITAKYESNSSIGNYLQS